MLEFIVLGFIFSTSPWSLLRDSALHTHPWLAGSDCDYSTAQTHVNGE